MSFLLHHCCLVYWVGECAVTTLTNDKVSFEDRKLGSPCVVCEGRITHTHGRLAAFGVCSAFMHLLVLYMHNIILNIQVLPKS